MNDHPVLDSLVVAGGTIVSLLTSEKTLIFLTIVFTIVRIYMLVRDRRKP